MFLPSRRRRGGLLAALAATGGGLAAGGCRGRDAARAEEPPAAPIAVTAVTVEGPPRMINTDPPFRYPAALYARRVQGNVTLRLWVDSAGAVRPESTRVAEPSGVAALDSSAVAGATQLRFSPGLREGRPVGAAILFPVYFRHPEAPALAGDSVLRPRP